MRFCHACLSVLLVTSVLVAQQAGPSGIVPKSLTEDQREIYRDVLRTYNSGSTTVLNVANETERFNAVDMAPAACLKDFSSADLHSVDIHRFAPDTFAGMPVRLVDRRLHQKRDPGDAIRRGESVDEAVEAGFAAGLFTFSEIVFDHSHTHAALDYSFVCGNLCGHGQTVVYERRNGHWVQIRNRFCGSWMS